MKKFIKFYNDKIEGCGSIEYVNVDRIETIFTAGSREVGYNVNAYFKMQYDNNEVAPYDYAIIKSVFKTEAGANAFIEEITNA